MSETQPEAGRRGQAIKALLRWLNSDETSAALEAMDLLQLDDADLELLLRNKSPDRVRRIPHLGRIT